MNGESRIRVMRYFYFGFVLHIYSVSLSPPVFVLYGMHGAFVGDCVYNMCMVFISLKWV